jgi:hypothetical protein
MTNEFIERVKAFAKEYDANQVCAIFMINKSQLEDILNSDSCEATIKKSKGKYITAIGEPKLETPTTDPVGWMNEEGL